MLFVFLILIIAKPVRADEWFLENNQIKFAISKDNGAIVGGWNKETGEKYIGVCNDLYDLETEITHKRSNEKDDKIISHKIMEGSQGRTLKIQCKNQVLGIDIEKTYRIDKKRLLKKVTFSKGEGFIEYESQVTLEPSFREGGYYHRPIFHVGKRALVPAEEVYGEIRIDKAWIPILCFVNLRKGYGVGHYRYKVNNKYVFPLSGVSEKRALWYTSKGWRINMFEEYIKKGGSCSVEVAYTIFKGDQLDFHLEYRNLPEYRAMDTFRTAPEWVKQVKLDCAWDQNSYKRGYLDRISKLAELLKPGYIMTTNWGWYYQHWGDYFSRPEDMKGWQPSFSEFKGWLEEFRRRSPYIKLGVTIFGSHVGRWMPRSWGNQKVRFLQEHPDWVIFGKDGKPYGMRSPLTQEMAYPRQLKAPGHIEYYLNQISEIMKNFGIDYIYVDGGCSGICLPDWKRKVVSQDYDWYRLWKGMAEIVHSFGGAIHYNCVPSIYSDYGYWEGHWWSLYNDDWRILADNLLYGQVYNTPGRGIGLVGTLWPGKMHDERTRLQINYWLALGYRPSFLSVKGVANKANLGLKASPYINAAFELRNRKVINALISPCWWKEDTEVEAYTMKQGDACFVSLINHGLENEKVMVSVNAKKLRLNPRKKIFLWLIAPKDPLKVDFSGVTWDSPPKELIKNRLLKVEDKVGKHINFDLELEPEIVRIVMITQSPGLLYSVNGKRTQCWLPETLDVEIRGTLKQEEKICVVSVKSKQNKCKVLIYFPKECGKIKSVRAREWSEGITVAAGGMKDIGYVIKEINGKRFLLIDLSKGVYEVIISGD